jgi:hypothetical protein
MSTPASTSYSFSDSELSFPSSPLSYKAFFTFSSFSLACSAFLVAMGRPYLESLGPPSALGYLLSSEAASKLP